MTVRGWFMACIRSPVTQWPDLCESDRYKGTLTAMNEEDLEWGPEHAHYCFSVSHFASSFLSRFHDKFLKMLPVKAVYERHSCKFEYQMERFTRLVLMYMLDYGAYCWRNELYPMIVGDGTG